MSTEVVAQTKSSLVGAYAAIVAMLIVRPLSASACFTPLR